MAGSISNWDRLFQQAFHHMRPGGYIEMREFRVWFYSQEGELSDESSVRQWNCHLVDGMNIFGKSINVVDELVEKLKAAGFVGVREDVLKVPVGPWPKDPRLKELGRWMQIQTMDAIEPLPLALFPRIVAMATMIVIGELGFYRLMSSIPIGILSRPESRQLIAPGAGAGGIATAARLAQEGFHVKVVEQHGFIGGRCSIISKDGYVFEETFQDLGTSLEQENVRLVKCEPNYCVWFPDKDIIELSTNLTRLKAQIQHHEGPDGFPRFCAFLNEAGTHYNLSLAHVLRKNFPGFLSLLRWDVLRSLISMHPWTSTYSRAARNHVVKGVLLEDGEELYADLVVINADLVYAYNELLPKTRRSHDLKKRPVSCSSISFFWSFDEKLPHLRAHNIFLAEKYRESFDAIFEDHRIPDGPSFYVNVPSKIDPTAAPPGKEAVVVLVPVGHLTSEKGGQLEEEKWDTLVSQTREIVLDTIEARTGLQDLRSRLVHEMVETPLSWEERFNLDRGAILGLSHSFFNVLSFRPQIKHPDIERLYFVGASTHPGTGVPVCLAGSKLVTQQIVEDWNMGIRQKPRSGFILTLVMALLTLVVSFLWRH
ncbi:unnamed protein product [Aspergillus oryzae]|uniref:Unnamed protein product n=1 Tax=Aspergillus oryzae TaxID=5062 RepID=A0AAN4YJE6_ASPOZ|nr:unnamed protein product [Aspergillus oryzae]GMF86313.1 unnamed protein product [Aspergillus oryzae]GMG31495.1 unnamed protein product [Aspergillus oryzae]